MPVMAAAATLFGHHHDGDSTFTMCMRWKAGADSVARTLRNTIPDCTFKLFELLNRRCLNPRLLAMEQRTRSWHPF